MICADFDTFLLAITPPRGARGQGGVATTRGGDSRDWDDVWWWLGAAGSKGEGSGGGDGGVALV
jgi:hypothetical protein